MEKTFREAYLAGEIPFEEIDEYRLQFMQPKYKNNFEAMLSVVDDLFAGKRDDVMDLAPNTSMGNMEGLKGGYLESWDPEKNIIIYRDDDGNMHEFDYSPFG